MRNPEALIGPIRQELTRLGVQETRTPEDVDDLLGPHGGTVLMVINSMPRHNGVLTLRLPKREAARLKGIPITG
jgi:hypothetical protein